MTKAELREAIKREARIKEASNLDTLVDDIIKDVLTDYANKARYYELLKEGIVITLVNGQQSYALPADYQNMNQVRYGRGPATVPTSTAYRVLDLQVPAVKQGFSQGWPRFYRFAAGPSISLWPYGAVLAVDQLLIDYYINPMSVFSADDDEFPIPRIESAVKKDVIARVQRYHAAIQETQMTDADAAASFNAADGASH